MRLEWAAKRVTAGSIIILASADQILVEEVKRPDISYCYSMLSQYCAGDKI
jgi:hypothetical protein